MRILVLGLGNDLMGDDAVGILTANELKERLRGKADVVSTALYGVALMELFIDYDRAIIIDAAQTGDHPPGTVFEIDPSELRPVSIPSPHYAGLPEMIDLAARMGLEFPSVVRIFAVEAEDVRTIGAGLSESVRTSFDELLTRVESLVLEWLEEAGHHSAGSAGVKGLLRKSSKKI